VLTGFGELALELGIRVEMVLDRPLRRARDEHELLGAGGDRFVDGILNERLVDDRQHLLRRRLGCRQEARAASRDWAYRRANLGHPVHLVGSNCES
jgi:hypothetical protein